MSEEHVPPSNGLSGLYIVSLVNEQPIGVNANDPRRAATCLRVNRLNCKFGKAKNLATRRKNYDAVFGAHNVRFHPIVAMDDAAQGERTVLVDLRAFRVRHSNGRMHEWLVGITPEQLEGIVLQALSRAQMTFRRIRSVVDADASARER
ncbi:MAG: hypothetical protein ABIR62_05505 [Dokdonella sp.]|uniref:hypothetical protein n=1 Tax=Dokdonella sp. TaxID=2291710 RepID=UPI0032638A46